MEGNSGYCFKAEGVSKARCYVKYETCSHRESNLRDQYPYATIQSQCQLHGLGRLNVDRVADANSVGR